MKIALVDDDHCSLEHLTKLISRQLDLMGDSRRRIDTYCSGEEFLESWKSGAYDLIILDIFMGEILGIDVAHKIRETDPDVRLAFCTSSNEFACESYEVNAHYYLQKPVSEQNIKRMLDRLNLEIIERIRTVKLSDGQDIILRNILFTQYSGHTAQIHLKNGTILRARITHSELEELLCEHTYFCCCSKGVIVNFYEATGIQDAVFHMTDKSLVPISRRKSKAVTEAYNRFHFAQMRKDT